MKNSIVFAVATVASLVIQPLTAQTTEVRIEATRTVIEEWVQTRQLISKEQSAWNADKQLLQHRIELFKTEIETLDQQIEESEEQATEAQRQRDALQGEIDVLKSASRVVEDLVDDYEAKITALAKRFPQPLRDKVDTFLTKLPKPGKKSPLSAGERLALVIGILLAVDQFNGNITLISELRKVPSGETAEVKTLYIGLAQAYYVDNNGRYAGVGIPSEGGWEWTSDNDIAENVSKAIAMYEGVMKPAAFVELPVTIR